MAQAIARQASEQEGLGSIPVLAPVEKFLSTSTGDLVVCNPFQTVGTLKDASDIPRKRLNVEEILLELLVDFKRLRKELAISLRIGLILRGLALSGLSYPGYFQKGGQNKCNEIELDEGVQIRYTALMINTGMPQ